MKLFRNILGVTAMALALAILGPRAFAATLTWPDSGAGVDLTTYINTHANAGDTIEITPGTYTYGSGATDLGANNEGDRGTLALKINKASITLQPSAGGTLGDVIFTGGNSHRVVESTSGLLTINKLIIKEGYYKYNTSNAVNKIAAGITAQSLILSDSIIENHLLVNEQLSSGTFADAAAGVIVHYSGPSTVTNTVFSGNVLESNGYGTDSIVAVFLSLPSGSFNNVLIENNKIIRKKTNSSSDSFVVFQPHYTMTSFVSSPVSNSTFKNNVVEWDSSILTTARNSWGLVLGRVSDLTNCYFEGNSAGVSVTNSAISNIIYKNKSVGDSSLFYFNGRGTVKDLYIGYNTFDNVSQFANGAARPVQFYGENSVIENFVFEYNQDQQINITDGTLKNSIFRYNKGNGIPIHVGGYQRPSQGYTHKLRITDCIIHDNEGTGAGGIYSSSAFNNGAGYERIFENNTIYSNKATGLPYYKNETGYAGGIAVQKISATSSLNSTLIIRNNTIYDNEVVRVGNSTDNAGGIYVTDNNTRAVATTSIVYNTITDNAAPGTGGVHFNTPQTPAGRFVFGNNLIVGNRSSVGNAMYNNLSYQSNDFPNVTVDNLVDSPGVVDKTSVFGLAGPVAATNGGLYVGINNNLAAGASLTALGFSSSPIDVPLGIGSYPYEMIKTILIARDGPANMKSSFATDFWPLDERGLPRQQIAGKTDFGAVSLQPSETAPNADSPAATATPRPSAGPAGPMPTPPTQNNEPVSDDYFRLSNYLTPTDTKNVYKALLIIDAKKTPVYYGYADVVVLLDVTSSMDQSRMSAAKASLQALIDSFYAKDSSGAYVNPSAPYINLAIVTYGAGGMRPFDPNPYNSVDPLLSSIWPGGSVPQLARAGIIQVDGQSSQPLTAGQFEVPSYFSNFNAYETGGSTAVPGGALGYSIDKLEAGWAYNARNTTGSQGSYADIDTPQAALVYARTLLARAEQEAVAASVIAHKQYIIMLNDGGSQMAFGLKSFEGQIVYSSSSIDTSNYGQDDTKYITQIKGKNGNATLFDYSDAGASPQNGALDVEYFLNNDETTAPFGPEDYLYTTYEGSMTYRPAPDSMGYLLQTIAEAEIIKEKNIPIYSIGLGDDFVNKPDTYGWFAKSLATRGIESNGDPNQDVFLVADANSTQYLKEAMKKIAGNVIADTLTDANGVKVNITLKDRFNVVIYQDKPRFYDTLSSQHLSSKTTESGKQITWKIDGVFSEGEVCELIFYVYFDTNEAIEDLWYQYSDAKLSYQRPGSTATRDLDFPIAYVKFDPSASWVDDSGLTALHTIAPDQGGNGGGGDTILLLPNTTAKPTITAIIDEEVSEDTEEMPLTGKVGITVGIIAFLLVGLGIGIKLKRSKMQNNFKNI